MRVGYRMEGNKVTGDETKERAPVMLATQTLKSRGYGWNPGEDCTEGRGHWAVSDSAEAGGRVV